MINNEYIGFIKMVKIIIYYWWVIIMLKFSITKEKL